MSACTQQMIERLVASPALGWLLLALVVPALAAAIVSLWRANRRLHDRIERYLLLERDALRLALLRLPPARGLSASQASDAGLAPPPGD